MLSGKEAPKRFDIRTMYPGWSDRDIAEDLADYFNRISLEMDPLGELDENTRQAECKPPELYEIAAKLKTFKKPNSRVYGDIHPKLVTPLADILAIPLHYIYSQVYQQLSWPQIWQTETVNIIPKTAAPTEKSQLRNLSCTPLYSKVLESFILDDLKRDVKLSNDQYGGLKGVSANHFLVGTWQKVLSALEDQRAAVSLLSIDFEKAFNRMCHSSCLNAISRLGASSSAIGLVYAFLNNRSMSVKVGTEQSTPRHVPGGSPQGSILGNFLFCATTDKLTQDVDYSGGARISYSSLPDGDGEDIENEQQSPTVNSFARTPGRVAALIMFSEIREKDVNLFRAHDQVMLNSLS